MKRVSALSAIMAAILIALSACAPATLPAPSAAPAVQPAPSPSERPAAQPVSGEDPWAKVEVAARKEDKLTIYSFILVGDAGLMVSRAFEQSTGIKTDVITGRGAEMLERIRTEARMGNQVGDVVQTSPLHLGNMKSYGLTAPNLDLPRLGEKDAWVVPPTEYDPSGHLISFLKYYFTPFVNSRLVKPDEEPRAYRDFVGPKWKGRKFIVDDVKTAGTIYNNFVPFTRLGILDEAYLKALGGQDPMFASSGFDAGKMLARGEAAAFLHGPQSVMAPLGKEGAPVKPVLMQEGTLAITLLFIRINNGPHPNAAKVFMNWLLSPEGQTVSTQAIGLSPVRKGVPDAMPAAIQVKPTKIVPLIEEDDKVQVKLFQEGYILKLWGLK